VLKIEPLKVLLCGKVQGYFFLLYTECMKKVFLKTYGSFLVGRTEGAEAFTALKKNMRSMPDDDVLFFDFSDIAIFAPAWCDEFFGEATIKYPGRIVIDASINEGLKKPLEHIAEVRGIPFTFGSFVDSENEQPSKD